MTAEPAASRPASSVAPADVARAEGVLWRRAGVGVVALPRAGDDVLFLQGSAAAVWLLLDRPRSFSALVLDLAEEFQVDRETVAADLVPAVDDMLARQLLRRTPA